MNSLAFEVFKSLDADCFVQIQGEGWRSSCWGLVTIRHYKEIIADARKSVALMRARADRAKLVNRSVFADD